MTEAMQTAIAEAVAKALTAQALNGKGKSKKAKPAKKGRAKLTDAERAAYAAANDAECIKVFTAAGYAEVQPRINVMTYNKWIANGRLVKKGEKGLKVGPFSLFHTLQTEALPVASPA